MARLIDTSVFIALERSGRPLEDIITEARTEPIALASITASELLVGVERADTAERRQRRSEFAEAVLTSIRVFPLDVAVARAHAQLWAELEGAGRQIGPYDQIVAATALVHEYDVLILNTREFKRVPGLGVVRPDW